MAIKDNVIQGVNPDLAEPNAISIEEANSKDFIPATDISQLATSVVFWHTNIMNHGQHVLNIDNGNPDDPQEVGIKVYEPKHAEAGEDGFRLLTPEELVPFKHGVRFLLDMVSELPFNYTPTDADEVPLPGYGSENDIEEQQTPT